MKPRVFEVKKNDLKGTPKINNKFMMKSGQKERKKIFYSFLLLETRCESKTNNPLLRYFNSHGTSLFCSSSWRPASTVALRSIALFNFFFLFTQFSDLQHFIFCLYVYYISSPLMLSSFCHIEENCMPRRAF